MTSARKETCTVRSYNLITDEDWNELDDETRRVMRAQRFLAQHRMRQSWKGDVIEFYRDWCLENCSGPVRLTRAEGYSSSSSVLIWFACEADAVAFKLEHDNKVVDS